MPFPRYAIYYTPLPGSPLSRFGVSVLGYDSFERVDIGHPHVEGLSEKEFSQITAEPRRYGFHATLVAPFHIEPYNEQDLIAALTDFTNENYPVAIDRLSVDTLGSFVALRTSSPIPQIDRLAESLVQCFDEFRAAPTEADRIRRLTSHLTPRQREMFARWGYPYVFEEFRFHMTLTGALTDTDLARVKSILTALYEPIAGNLVEIDGLSLVRQDSLEARFYVLSRMRFKKK